MAEETEHKQEPDPTTKAEVEDDVQWLEERLEKQDASLAEIKAELLSLKEQRRQEPEAFSQEAKQTLSRIEEKLADLLLKPSSPPASPIHRASAEASQDTLPPTKGGSLAISPTVDATGASKGEKEKSSPRPPTQSGVCFRRRPI